MHSKATELVGDHLVAQKAPFSISLMKGGEEICSAPFVYVKSLEEKVDSMLDQNERYM